NPRPHLLQALELAEVLRELVVERRDLAAPDRAHAHAELRLLAGEHGAPVIVREAHADRALLAGAGADELLLEAGDQLRRAELDGVLLRGAAGERLAIDAAREIDREEVTGRSGRVLGLLEELGVPLAQRLELLLHVLVGDRRGGPPRGQALDRAELDRGLHLDARAIGERTALGRRRGVDRRLADGL